MSFLDRFRRRGPTRIDVPEQLPATEVGALRVHTAETLVILSTDLRGARALIDIAGARTPQQLTCGQARPVNLLPLPHDQSVPTLDPQQGWLLPLSPETCAEILAAVSTEEPGEYELSSLNLALVIEATKP